MKTNNYITQFIAATLLVLATTTCTFDWDNPYDELGNNYNPEKETEYNSITDYDGNSYKIVTIGTQTWMAENLKVTHYPNGTAIPLITDNTTWGNLDNNDTDDACCFYNNNSDSEYGALYTYAAAKNACPTDWHLPTDEEWTILINYISNDGHLDKEGVALKATNGWNDESNGTDDYGFSALPGGWRDKIGSSRFSGFNGYWWSATEKSNTEVYIRRLDFGYEGVVRHSHVKSLGFSVRCIKD